MVHFGTEESFDAFKRKVNDYYKWCDELGRDPQNDENWITYHEIMANV
jgi:hypothetical protein